MIKKYTLVALISLCFVACNKDGDIVIDNPGDIPQQPETTLGYSVLEYTPAPGQYINDPVTGFDNITTPEAAIARAEERLSEGLFVSLGSWGGYIIVKFDEPIINTGDYDFSIASNAFDTSNEPGIVWVMSDDNKNRLPDDTWYELKGSDFGKEGYERNYWVRYTRPEAKSDTPWEDSNGETGVVKWFESYHSQPFYYPEWIKDDSFTYYGSRLSGKAQQDPETGLWSNPPFEWGYADNFGIDFLKDGRRNPFRISDAVDEENEPADLKSIDFVKVQTAINASSGWLGENSTEVCGFFAE